MNLINKAERIFVAGANGMAGSAIVRSLKKNNYGFKEFGGELLTPSRKELNLFNYNEVEDWFKAKKPTVVILAAARVGGIFANSTKSADFILENLKIQNNVIENSWRFNVKRLLFLGSSCIYPKYAKQPIKEEYLLQGYLEKSNSAYAIAKIAGLKLCESLRTQYGFDAISLMPTNLYGPGDNYKNNESHVMAALIRRFYEANNKSSPEVVCWGTGSVLREFMHVDDLGEAVLFALEKWDPRLYNAPKDNNGNPLNHLNVGTGKDITVKELSLKIANTIGYKGKVLWDFKKPDGTPRKQLDTSQINNMGWKAKISLEEGLISTFKDFKNIFKILND